MSRGLFCILWLHMSVVAGAPTVEGAVSTGTRSVIRQTVVEASPVTVFRMFVTSDGVQQFLAERAYIEPYVGGAYALTHRAAEGSRRDTLGTRVATVLSLEPGRSLSFSWRGLPSMSELCSEPLATWVEVMIQAVPDEPGKAVVRIAHHGFGSGGGWDQAYRYYAETYWPRTIRALEKCCAAPSVGLVANAESSLVIPAVNSGVEMPPADRAAPEPNSEGVIVEDDVNADAEIDVVAVADHTELRARRDRMIASAEGYVVELAGRLGTWWEGVPETLAVMNDPRFAGDLDQPATASLRHESVPTPIDDQPVFYVALVTQGIHWRPYAEWDETLSQAHLSYMRELHAAGHVAYSGSFLDDSGTMTILAAGSLDEARRLMQDEPAARAGVLYVDVRPWLVSMQGSVDQTRDMGETERRAAMTR